MKNNTYLIIILSIFIQWPLCITAQSYSDGLKVLNPNQGNWTKTAGKFESVDLTITPAGNYTNIDIELEISAQNTMLSNMTDSLEAEYKFSLPKGAIIHNAILWMNGIPVKAELYERSKAKFIYESLVSRRIDPLILYQNEQNSYEARIYPIINPSNRKLKISYLVPNTITQKGIEVPLDLRMFRSDIAGWMPTINIKIANNSIFGMPYLMNSISTAVVGNYTQFSITSTPVNLYLNNAVYFNNPASSSFLLTQPTSANEGFYQFMVLPTSSSSAINKMVYVVDYKTVDYISYSTLMNMLKNKIKFNMRDSDLFNVVFVHNGNVMKMSTTWINASASSIDNAFASLPVNLSSTNSSFLQATLDAIGFINNNGADGSILMVSNAGSTNSNANFINQLIMTTMNAMTITYPITILDFNNQFNYSIWNGTDYFYNNEYYFYNLAIVSGGNYFNLRNNGSNSWYYNASSSLIDMFSQSFTASKKHHMYDAVSTIGNSVFHSEYQVKNKIIIPVGEAYMEVGRYITTPATMQFNYYYGIDSINYQDNYSVNAVVATDTFAKKIWGSNFVDELISNNTSNAYTNTIINNSILYDVLCEYTALLALEPDTAGTITNEVPLATSTIEKSKFELVAYPNPFNETQTIEFNVDDISTQNTWELKVMNTIGQVLYTSNGDIRSSGKQAINWYNASTLNLPKGIYILTIKIGENAFTLKVYKQ